MGRIKKKQKNNLKSVQGFRDNLLVSRENQKKKTEVRLDMIKWRRWFRWKAMVKYGPGIVEAEVVANKGKPNTTAVIELSMTDTGKV